MARAIGFKESNHHLGAGSGHNPAIGEVATLYIRTDGIVCTSKWRMTWKERLSALYSGHVWIMVASGRTQPPIAVTALSPW